MQSYLPYIVEICLGANIASVLMIWSELGQGHFYVYIDKMSSFSIYHVISVDKI